MKLQLTDTTRIDHIKALTQSDTIIVGKHCSKKQIAAIPSNVRVELEDDCSAETVERITDRFREIGIPGTLTDKVLTNIAVNTTVRIYDTTSFATIEKLKVSTLIIPLNGFRAFHFIAINLNVKTVILVLNEVSVARVDLTSVAQDTKRFKKLFDAASGYLNQQLIEQKQEEINKLKLLQDAKMQVETELRDVLSGANNIIENLQMELEASKAKILELTAEINKMCDLEQVFNELPELPGLPTDALKGIAQETDIDDAQIVSLKERLSTVEQRVAEYAAQNTNHKEGLRKLAEEKQALEQQLTANRLETFQLNQELMALREASNIVQIQNRNLLETILQLQAEAHAPQRRNKRTAGVSEHPSLEAPKLMRVSPQQSLFPSPSITLVDGLIGTRYSQKR